MSDRFNEKEWRELLGSARTTSSSRSTPRAMSVSDDVNIANENNVLLVLQGGLQSIMDSLNNIKNNPNANVPGESAFVTATLQKLFNIVVARESYTESLNNPQAQKFKHRAL